MKVSTKQHIGLSAVLLLTCSIAFALMWANSQVTQATENLNAASGLLRTMSEQRMLTSEYVLRPNARGLSQRTAVLNRFHSQMLDESITRSFPELQANMLRRRNENEKVFAELQTLATDNTDLRQLLFSQILIQQQENFADSYKMMRVSTQRINDTQSLTFQIGLIGLALIALANMALSAIQHKHISKPLQHIQAIARRIAQGQSHEGFKIAGNDEISLLAQDLEDMSAAQRQLLDEQTASNHRLASLNHELESFSYSVSHDLRGPLRSMDGFSLCLLEDYGDKLDADGVDALQRIRAASQRMGLLIDDVLALSRITRIELSVVDVDVSAMAKEIAASIDQENKGAKIDWCIADNIHVAGDRPLLKLALVNLLSNAHKFSSKSLAPKIEVECCQRDGKEWVRIRDNGVGFDMTYVNQLFGVFKRLHHADDFPGTGIGLAIVQRVIHRHSGEVFATSEPGQGAAFYFHTGINNL